MHVIHVRNVNQALPLGTRLLLEQGVARQSRNGAVVVANAPVTTCYERPSERVLFAPERDANPFFHLMECLWMLAGRDDVAFVKRYVARMAEYSDDGVTLHGAYGKRWRDWFHPADGVSGQGDQLARIIAALKADPEDRRQVLSMWDGFVDPGVAQDGGKDVPCNTQAYVSVGPDGRLNLTVCNRSNDMVWGAYGANAVHFSFLQEYLAAGVGVPVGRYFQVSNNFHGYEKSLKQVEALGQEPEAALGWDLYDETNPEPVEPYRIVNTDVKTWDEDLHLYLDDGATIGLRDPFFRRVVVPMENAHKHYRSTKGEGRFLGALEITEQVQASDWRRAAQMWLQRRYAKWQRAADDGVSHAAE